MDALFPRLSLREIEILIENLGSGSLSLPFTELGLTQLFGRQTGPQVFLALDALTKQSFNAKQILATLELLKTDRLSRGRSLTDLVSLVWTGPETPGVTNRDTKVVVQELFSRAESSVLVAGFAVYQGRDVFKALANRMDERPDLKVSMYLNVQRRQLDTTASAEILREFALKFRRKDWPGKRLPHVFYDPRSLALDGDKRAVLHAKCIVVDKKIAFVSSANFTEAAQERNIEAGVLIEADTFADKLQGHFEALTQAGALLPAPGITSA